MFARMKYGLIPVLLLVAGCRQESLYTGLAERDVNEMAAVLLQAGIPVERTRNTEGKYDLSISDSRYFAEAVTLLNDRGLPRKEFEDFGKVFKGDSLVSTPTEIKARYMYALTQQLERTLSEIGGVITARVQVVMPDSDPITRQRTPAGASVVITHDPALSPNALVPKVKQIVASSVDGLTYDGVSVTLFVKPRPGLGNADAERMSGMAVAPVKNTAATGSGASAGMWISKLGLPMVLTLIFGLLWLKLNAAKPRRKVVRTPVKKGRALDARKF